MTSTRRAAATLAAACAVVAFLHAQGRGGVEWTTLGGDAQRTASMKTDPRISPESMVKGGPFGSFKFLWKLKLEYDPQAATVLTPPILLNNVIGFRGFKSIVFVATQSETLHAIDYDMGAPLWKYHINYSANPAPVLAGTPECPGGMSAAASRPTPVAPASPAGRGSGGARGARSGGGVGEPGKGAITIGMAGQRGTGLPAGATAGAQAGAPQGAAAGAPGAGGAPARGAVPPRGRGGPFQAGDEAAYVVGSDGYLHALNVQNGWDQMTPILFLPPNTHAVGLIVASSDDARIAYAATTHGCGAQDDAVWAMDLRDSKKTVTNFRPGGAAIAGTAGLAIGHDGTVYASTAKGSLFALEPKTLNVKASASLAGASFTSSPVVITWKDKDAVIVAGGGKLYLFDPSALGAGAVAVSPLFEAGDHDESALASWTDAQNTQWIAASMPHGVTTFKLSDRSGRPTFETGWSSRDIASPLPPVVANGVLFAASRGTKTAPAVLYGLDAASGKELWNSGRGITSPLHGALAVSQGNVFVPATDGTLYAFGFEIEK